jgi:hypothetical protein
MHDLMQFFFLYFVIFVISWSSFVSAYLAFSAVKRGLDGGATR